MAMNIHQVSLTCIVASFKSGEDLSTFPGIFDIVADLTFCEGTKQHQHLASVWTNRFYWWIITAKPKKGKHWLHIYSLFPGLFTLRNVFLGVSGLFAPFCFWRSQKTMPSAWPLRLIPCGAEIDTNHYLLNKSIKQLGIGPYVDHRAYHSLFSVQFTCLFHGEGGGITFVL